MRERLEGLDEAVEKEAAEENGVIVSMGDAKKKRRPFHYWTVDGVDHKMKLTTKMITQLENKYRTNVMNLVITDSVPPLSVMLTIAQAAIIPFEHGTRIEKVNALYDKWLEEGGSQQEFLTQIIMPTLAVSGFFTTEQVEELMKELDERLALE